MPRRPSAARNGARSTSPQSHCAEREIPRKWGRVRVFLASGQANLVNGTTIECDGGMLPGVLYEAGLKTITDLL